jgi:hypothetical protein
MDEAPPTITITRTKSAVLVHAGGVLAHRLPLTRDVHARAMDAARHISATAGRTLTVTASDEAGTFTMTISPDGTIHDTTRATPEPHAPHDPDERTASVPAGHRPPGIDFADPETDAAPSGEPPSAGTRSPWPRRAASIAGAVLALVITAGGALHFLTDVPAGARTSEPTPSPSPNWSAIWPSPEPTPPKPSPRPPSTTPSPPPSGEATARDTPGQQTPLQEDPAPEQEPAAPAPIQEAPAPDPQPAPAQATGVTDLATSLSTADGGTATITVTVSGSGPASVAVNIGGATTTINVTAPGTGSATLTGIPTGTQSWTTSCQGLTNAGTITVY